MGRPGWLSPWEPSPALLVLLVLASPIRAEAPPFPMDLQPISVVRWEGEFREGGVRGGGVRGGGVRGAFRGNPLYPFRGRGQRGRNKRRRDSRRFPVFQGLQPDNDTRRLGLDYQTMTRVRSTLYIAARDHVFAVNLSRAAQDLDLTPQLKM
ncbi:unnamed protein product [Boreogadus saida]